MGRPLRRQVPGEYYLVTNRCHQARHFLRPDPQINDAVMEWLARAQKAFPGIRLHAVCVMSNHLHLVVHDQKGELAAWAGYFLSNLARAVNRIRKRSGKFFARRHSAEPILDDEALIDRLLYVVTNPVKANLCKRAEQWPGVLLWAPEGVAVERNVSWVDRNARRRLNRRARNGARVPTPRVHGRLRIDPLPSDGTRSDLAEALRAREHAFAAQRRAEGRKTLTKAQILRQNWHAAPRHPKRSARPPCHTSDPSLRRAFIEGFREFTALFREASERLRGGARSVPFPDWSFPPGGPLFRPAFAASP
jgi:REP element-mobilizing transposase RayT